MKTLLLFFTIFATTTGLWFAGRPYLQSFEPIIEELTEKVCCEIEVKLKGATAVSKADLSRLLPYERSIFWWQTHRDDIRASLLTHPFIEEVELEGSGLFPWGQFTLVVKERSPAYLAVMPDKKLWLVSDRGQLVRLFADSVLPVDSLPLVRGLVPSRHVDERTVLRRALYVQEFLKEVKELLPHTPEALTLFGNGDLKVIFEDIPFPVVFGSYEGNLKRVSVELLRFKEIISKLTDSETVASIDLAFEQSAVIKRKDAPKKKAS